MQKRSIGMMIFLSIITLGLYFFYWTIVFQVELKRKTNEGYGGLGHFVMLLITLGLYHLYWSYKVGERLNMVGRPNNGVLYLVLIFFGVGALINPFLMQNEANKSTTSQVAQNKQISV